MQEQQISDLPKQLGQWVKHRRQELKLTQAQVAEAMTEAGTAIDPTGVLRIEKGTRTTKLDEFFTLAKALRTTPTRMLDGVEASSTAVAMKIAEAWHLRSQVVMTATDYVQARWELVHLLMSTTEELTPATRSEIDDLLTIPGDLGPLMEHAIMQAGEERLGDYTGLGDEEELAKDIVAEQERMRRDLVNSIPNDAESPIRYKSPDYPQGEPVSDVPWINNRIDRQDNGE